MAKTSSSSSGPLSVRTVRGLPPRSGDQAAAPPQKEKRRRVGRPKVRTGCITWIRRIKCDEQKPACQRCVSTGRTCDGYGNLAKPDELDGPGGSGSLAVAARSRFPPPPPPPPQQQQQGTAIVRHDARRAPPRLLAADFAGDMIERQYIHHWLPIAQDVVRIRERQSDIFWLEVVPEYALEIPGIRHAIVALSAANELVERHGMRRDMSAPPSKLECFIIRQYNKSMQLVRAHVDDVTIVPRKRFGTIVMACILFFYTEILLSQWPTAMMHILNGLKIMANPPDEISFFLDPRNWKARGTVTHIRVLYITRLLCRWETTAGFLASGNRPSMTISAWKPTERRACGVPDQVESLEHLCEVADVFYREALAFLWLCANSHRGGESPPWDAATFRLQHDVLQQRAHLLAELLERCRDAYGALPSIAAAPRFLAYQSRWLHLRSATLCLDAAVPPLGDAYPFPADFRATQRARLDELFALARVIRVVLQRSLAAAAAAATAAPAPGSGGGVDYGVVSALYLAATRCAAVDANTRRGLFAVIRDWPWQENLWDGPALRSRLIQGQPIETPPTSPEEIDPAGLSKVGKREISHRVAT